MDSQKTKEDAWRENPFAVLGVTPMDNQDAIDQAVDAKFFDMTEEEERRCNDAKAILETPQKRIIAELRWFCGTIASDIKEMTDALGRGEMYRSAFQNPLAEFTFRANLLPHQDVDALAQAILRLDELDRSLTPEKLASIVNGDREVAKFPRVQTDAVAAAWDDVRADLRRTFHALGERLGKETYVKLANDIARRAFQKNDACGRVVETFLENYELDVSADVEQQKEPLADLLKGIDAKDVHEEQLQQLETMVPAIAVLTQPLTAWHVAQGLADNDLGVDIFYAVRSRAIDIYNDGKDIASSQRLMKLLETAFPILPEEAQKKLALDLKTLEENAKAAQHSPDYDKIIAFIDETSKLVEARPDDPEGSHEHARENSVFYMKEWKQNREPRLRRMLAGASCSESEWQVIHNGCAYLYMICTALGSGCIFGDYSIQEITAAAHEDANQELEHAKQAKNEDAVKDAQEWIELYEKAEHDWEEAMAGEEPDPEPAPRRPQPRVSLEKPSAPPTPQPEPRREPQRQRQQQSSSKLGRLVAAAVLLLALGFGAYHMGASSSASKSPSTTTAQATTSNTSKPVQKEAKREMKSDLSLGGLDLDMTVDEVHKALGKENSTKEEGELHILYYPDLHVNTRDKIVSALVSESPAAETKRGIHEGSSLADIQKAYGTDCATMDYDDLTLYEYSFKSLKGHDGLLRFAVKKSDNTVKYISVRIPQEEKPAQGVSDAEANKAAQRLNDYYQYITHSREKDAYGILSADMQKHMGTLDQFKKGYRTTLSHSLSDLTLLSTEGNDKVTIGYTLTAHDRASGGVLVQTFRCEATLSKATGSWHIVNMKAKKQSEHME